jgi:hypothetical protein
VQALARSLGGACSLTSKKVRDNEQALWTVRGRISGALGAPFKLSRKIDSYVVHSNEYVRSIVSAERVDTDEAICIKVAAENGLFITEDYVVTHNTDFYTPLSIAKGRLMDEYDRKGMVTGDIVFITDGECGLTPEFIEEIKEAKRIAGFKIWTILIGFDRSCLTTFSDRIIYLDEINEKVAGAGVRDVFGGV